MSRTFSTLDRPGLIPGGFVVLIGGLLAAILIGVGGLRLSGWEASVAPGAVLKERALRFADLEGGAIGVIDTSDGATVQILRGEQGFVRGVLRGLARERRQHGLDRHAPFLLSLRDDGRLLLTDPSTGQRIDLASFGPDNAAVFARWLPSAGPPSPNPSPQPSTGARRS